MWNPEIGPSPAELGEADNSSARAGAAEAAEEGANSAVAADSDNKERRSDSSETVKPEGTPEEEASREELKPNDLIVPDDHVESAMKILKNARINCRNRQIRESTTINAQGTIVPGEFAIAILDPAADAQPADSQQVTSAFEVLRRSRITVRFAVLPGSETSNPETSSKKI